VFQAFATDRRDPSITYLQVITAQTVALSNERNQVDILRAYGCQRIVGQGARRRLERRGTAAALIGRSA
jgi:hypothetical protein